MKLVTKISVGMGMLGLLMTLLAGYLLWQMAELNSITSVLAHRNVPVSELAGEINTDTAEYRAVEFQYLIENDAQKSSALSTKIAGMHRKGPKRRYDSAKIVGQHWSGSVRIARAQTGHAATQCPCPGHQPDYGRYL